MNMRGCLLFTNNSFSCRHDWRRGGAKPDATGSGSDPACRSYSTCGTGNTHRARRDTGRTCRNPGRARSNIRPARFSVFRTCGK